MILVDGQTVAADMVQCRVLEGKAVERNILNLLIEGAIHADHFFQYRNRADILGQVHAFRGIVVQFTVLLIEVPSFEAASHRKKYLPIFISMCMHS